jgi:predicted metalloendopeptidase
MSSELNTGPNFHSPGQRALHAYTPGDDFYERLIATHQGLSDEQSRLVNARLVLLLANHIGDLGVLGQALKAARTGIEPAETAA